MDTKTLKKIRRYQPPGFFKRNAIRICVAWTVVSMAAGGIAGTVSYATGGKFKYSYVASNMTADQIDSEQQISEADGITKNFTKSVAEQHKKHFTPVAAKSSELQPPAEAKQTKMAAAETKPSRKPTPAKEIR